MQTTKQLKQNAISKISAIAASQKIDDESKLEFIVMCVNEFMHKSKDNFAKEFSEFQNPTNAMANTHANAEIRVKK